MTVVKGSGTDDIENVIRVKLISAARRCGNVATIKAFLSALSAAGGAARSLASLPRNFRERSQEFHAFEGRKRFDRPHFRNKDAHD